MATKSTKQAHVTVSTITLTGKQPLKPFRANSARALGWAWLQEMVHNTPTEPGCKPGTVHLAPLAQAWQDNPPTTPKNGKLAGQPEPFSGWVTYWRSQNLLTTGQASVPASTQLPAAAK